MVETARPAAEPPAAASLADRRQYGGAHPKASNIALGSAVLSLVVLVFVSTMSLSQSLLRVAVIVYLVSSFMWAYMQFLYEEAPSPWAGWISIGLIGAAALTVIAWIPSRADALPLISGILLYAGAGWGVQWLRHRQTSPRWGKWAFFAGIVAVTGSAIWMTRVSGSLFIVPLVIFGVALLLAIPIGLNLMSEGALRRLGDPGPWRISVPRLGTWSFDTRKVAFSAIAAGVVVPLLAIAAVWQLAHSWMPALMAAGGVLVLTVAMVSNTHFDIALVIATLALLAAAPPDEKLPDKLKSGSGTSALVAMGDSYMSGEGAPRFYSGTDDGGRNECRRAPTAYAARAAGEEGSHFDAVTFMACSGGRASNVISGENDTGAKAQQGEDGTQVDQLKRILAENPNFKPKLVAISVGGNDSGFATIGEICLAPGDCFEQRALFEDNLPAVYDALVAAYASLRLALPSDVPIVAVPYPQPVMTAGGCEGLPLSKSERTFIDSFVTKLNETVRRAADKAGLYYMDTMQSALARANLQLCDPENNGKPGLHTVALGSVSGLASARFSPAKWIHNSLHPNRDGHNALLDVFNAWVGQHPDLPPKHPPTTADVDPGATAEPVPPCSFTTEIGTSKCRSQAREWEVQQVVQLWPWAFALIPALVSLWLLSVGALSFRRRALNKDG